MFLDYDTCTDGRTDGHYVINNIDTQIQRKNEFNCTEKNVNDKKISNQKTSEHHKQFKNSSCPLRAGRWLSCALTQSGEVFVGRQEVDVGVGRGGDVDVIVSGLPAPSRVDDLVRTGDVQQLPLTALCRRTGGGGGGGRR